MLSGNSATVKGSGDSATVLISENVSFIHKTFFQGLLVDLSKKAMITGNYKVDISNSVVKQTKPKRVQGGYFQQCDQANKNINGYKVDISNSVIK